MMRGLDLFAGTGSATQPFADRGHTIWTLDNDPDFRCDFTEDIRHISADVIRSEMGRPEVIWASPPCEKFSVASSFAAWGPGYDPVTPEAKHAIENVRRTVALITLLEPTYWIIENPVGMLRKLDIIPGPWDHATITQCQYHRTNDPGPPRRKATDLWGRFPPSLILYPPCSNGDGCHIAAPRGSTTGTQGLSPVRAGALPYLLGLTFCLAIERDLPEARKMSALGRSSSVVGFGDARLPVSPLTSERG